MFDHQNGEWPAFLREKYRQSIQKGTRAGAG